MNTENKAWWRGTFPSWIVATLLGIIAWFLVGFVADVKGQLRDAAMSSINSNLEISRLQEQTRRLALDLLEVKQGQRDIVREVQAFLRK